jgi:hypothetical protein
MEIMFFRSEKVLAILFAHITRTFGDSRCEHPQNGECWQYMGTSGIFHEFRHRDLPAEHARPGYPPGRTYYRLMTGEAVRKRIQVQPLSLDSVDCASFLWGHVLRSSTWGSTLVKLDSGLELWLPTERLQVFP